MANLVWWSPSWSSSNHWGSLREHLDRLTLHGGKDVSWGLEVLIDNLVAHESLNKNIPCLSSAVGLYLHADSSRHPLHVLLLQVSFSVFFALCKAYVEWLATENSAVHLGNSLN